MQNFSSKFNVPKVMHKNIWFFLLYKIGLHRYSFEEERNLIGNYLRNFFDLEKIEKIDSYSPDLPKVSGFVAYNKSSNVKAFGLDTGGETVSVAKVFGEYLERFIFIDPKYAPKSIKMTISDLRNLYKIVLPIDFDDSRDEPKNLLEWVKTTEYISGKNVLYPKNCFFYGDQVYDSQNFLYPKNSTGGAAWYDYDGALSRALLEIVEREAVVLIFQKYLSAREIVFDIELENVKKAQADFAKYGLRFNIFNITSDINVAVFLVYVEDLYNESNYYTVSASGSSYTTALNSVISEMYQNLHQLNEPKDLPKSDILNLLRKSGEKNYFSDLQNLHNFSLHPKEITKRIESALGKINVYVCAPFNPYLKALHFTVVKVVVPEMLSYALNISEKIHNQKRLDIFSKNTHIK